MSDDPRPELRELAARLFAAGRAERPGQALERRLSLIQPRAGVEREPPVSGRATVGRGLVDPGAFESRGDLESHAPLGAQPHATVARHAMHARRGIVASRRLRWVAGVAGAVALAAGAAGMFVTGAREDEIAISAERGPAPHPRLATEGARRAPAEQPPARANDVTVVDPSASAHGAPAPETASRSLPAAARSSAGGARGPAEASTAASARVRLPSDSAASDAVTTPRPLASSAGAVTSSDSATHGNPITLVDELALLKDARAALRSGDPARALELLDRHAAAQGSNGLRSEAALLRIETLAALGQHDAASDLAVSFVRDEPHSPLSDRAKTFIRPPQPTP